jgi:hypothetical protein
MAESIYEDAYRRFSSMWADSEPVRSERELEAAIRAAGLGEQPVPDDWLRSLRRDWVYGDSDEPFADQGANRVYRRELMS